MAEILEKEKSGYRGQHKKLSYQGNCKAMRKWPEKSGGNFGEREDDPKVGQQKQKFQEFDSFFAARI